MMPIKKGKEPGILHTLRRKYKGESDPYELFRNNHPEYYKMVRSELLKEQQGHCCYCMAKILEDGDKSDKMSVEHFKPKSKHHSESLRYSNLLASCSRNYSCNHSKGDKNMEFIPNPADKIKHSFFDEIEYKWETGEISINNYYFNNLTEEDKKKLEDDINEKLKLNCVEHKEFRKKKVQKIINKKLQPDKNPPIGQIKFCEFIKYCYPDYKI